MEAKDITEALWKGLGILFAFYVQYAIYIVARGLSAESKCSKFEVYLRAIGVSLLIGFTAWALYGTHVEDADPLFGGGMEVVDSTPTDLQRNQHGIAIITVVSTLIVTGTFVGLRDRSGTDLDRTEGEKVSLPQSTAAAAVTSPAKTHPLPTPGECLSGASPEWSKSDYPESG